MYFVECAYCGKVDNHNAGRCTGCGAQYTADAQKLCNSCKHRIPLNNKFCGICGTSIAPQQIVQQEALQQPINQPQNIPQQPVIINNYTTPTTETKIVVEKKRRSCLFDCFMIFITCGFWIIWMIVRR